MFSTAVFNDIFHRRVIPFDDLLKRTRQRKVVPFTIVPIQQEKFIKSYEINLKLPDFMVITVLILKGFQIYEIAW